MKSCLLLNKRNIKYIIAFISILLGEISDVYHIEAFLLIGVVTCVIYSLFLPDDENILFIFILIAPNRILTIGGISAPIIIMSIYIVKLLVTQRYIMRKNIFIGSFLVIVSSFLCSGMDTTYIISCIKIILMLLYYEQVFAVGELKEMQYNIVKYLSIGCIMSTCITLLISPSSISEGARFTLADNGGQNVLGILCSILVLYIIINRITGRFRNKEMMIYAIIVFTIGILTGSRSYLLSIGIGIVLICFWSLKTFNTKLLVHLLSLIFIVVSISIIFYVSSDFIQTFVNQQIYRMNRLSDKDISNGRTGLWESYFRVFNQYPRYFWFGHLKRNDLNISYVAHNMIIEQIAQIGFVVSCFIITLYIMVFLNLKRKFTSFISKMHIYIIPFISFFIVSFFSHTWLGLYQTTILFMCFVEMLELKNKGVKT